MLIGNVLSMASSGFLVVVITHFTSKMSDKQANEIWEHTKDIDNPIYPWTDLYKRY